MSDDQLVLFEEDHTPAGYACCVNTTDSVFAPWHIRGAANGLSTALCGAPVDQDVTTNTLTFDGTPEKRATLNATCCPACVDAFTTATAGP